MELDLLSINRISELEQQITQLLKTMRTAKIQNHAIYQSLQKFEQELSEARRNRFDEENSEYTGY